MKAQNWLFRMLSIITLIAVLIPSSSTKARGASAVGASESSSHAQATTLIFSDDFSTDKGRGDESDGHAYQGSYIPINLGLVPSEAATSGSQVETNDNSSDGRGMPWKGPEWDFAKQDVVFFDDFSDPNSGWPRASLGDICSFDYYNGHYRVKVTEYYESCIIPAFPVPKQVNGTFSVKVRRTSDSSRHVLYGFFFGAGTNAYRDRWALEVSPDKDCGDKGFFWLSAIEDGEDKGLIGNACTDAIKIGNDWNELKVIRTLDKIHVYMNNTLSGTYDSLYLRDKGYFDLEVVSLYSGTSNSAPVYVEFDDFTVLGDTTSDTTSPAAITNLSASTGSTSGTTDLIWTAPGDDGDTGTASKYIMRYATSAITTEAAWAAANDVSGEPTTPSPAGSAESMTVSGLTPGQTYYFAIKTQDEVPNTSRLSNSPNAVAWPPVFISRIEVNQATQNMEGEYGTIPLVANKHTAVRVHVYAPDKTPDVTGTLIIKTGGTPVAAPIFPENGPIVAGPYPQPHLNANDTLNFFVPDDVLDPGTYDFEVRLAVKDQVVDTHQISPTFHMKGSIRILYYPLRPLLGTLPSLSRAATADAFLLDTYPISWNSVNYLYGGYVGDIYSLCGFIDGPQVLNGLERKRAEYNARHENAPADFAVGIVPENCLSKCIGYTWDGIDGAAIVEDNADRDVLGATFAHEIGHLLGLGDEYEEGRFKCEVNPPNASVKDIEGNTCPSDAYTSPVDGNKNGNYVSSRAFDVRYMEPAFRRLSFMGKAATKRRWVTDVVYTYLYSDATALQPSQQALVALDTGDFLIMSGLIYQDDTVELDPWFHINGTMTPTAFEKGGYSIELRDSSNAVLASHDFTISFEMLSNPPQTLDVAPFFFVIPYPAGTSMILIKHDRVIIKTVSVSGNTPTVSVTSPNGSESWNGEQTIMWTASDPDGDPLAYIIEYTPNDSDWYPIAANITTTHFIWDTGYSPGGTNARIRVIASDGINTSQDESDGTFTVTSKAPIASIVSPVDGIEVVSGSSVAFSGIASDPEDGQLGGSSLTWSSSLSGALGTGELLFLNTLPDGTQTITLTAMDSDAMVSTDSITITILTDTDGDGMPDTWENTYAGLDPNTDDAIDDPDSDDLINLDEYYYGTDPTDPDTDDDGYEDGFEIKMGSDPLDSASIPNLVYLPIILKND